MNQKIFDGIVDVLQRGSGVMAQEYVQAFVGCVNKLQEYMKKEQDAKAAQPTPAPTAQPETPDFLKEKK